MQPRWGRTRGAHGAILYRVTMSDAGKLPRATRARGNQNRAQLIATAVVLAMVEPSIDDNKVASAEEASVLRMETGVR